MQAGRTRTSRRRGCRGRVPRGAGPSRAPSRRSAAYRQSPRHPAAVDPTCRYRGRPPDPPGALDLPQLLLLGGKELIDLRDVLIRLLLEILLRATQIVLRDLAVLLHLLELVLRVTTNVPDGDTAFFGAMV